ncbi:MAG TPA: PaaX family transcriptional regulator C-terminal domain-containing protein [Acidimicrobiales bacterium]|nr:PaaX family transcriptional regulator C-terminal domain-containing protein [Acidimicrobiales bacterium]
MVKTTVSIPTRVLVLGMAHEDGTVVADEVLPVAEACGLTAEQVRSCLRRLVKEELFTRDGTGRNARFRATEQGLKALGSSMERHRLAYVQDHAGRGWDRKWRMVSFAVPESKRAARDALRDRLLALGGAPLANGLYVSPHRWEKDVAGEAERLGVDDAVTQASTDDLTVGGVSDPRELVKRLWPIDEIAARYEQFVTTYRGVPDALERMRARRERLADAVFLPGALSVTVEFTEIFADDPLLPPELLPRPWPGRAARELLVRSRRLALLLREQHNRPALFRSFDDVIESIP